MDRFIENKYNHWYYSIISNAQKEMRNKENSYFERHHILPRCLGGSNTRSNTVLLTAREHYICHLLLTKMTIGRDKQKMWNALHRFIHGNSGQRQVNSKHYEQIKKQYSVITSERFKGKPLSQNVKDKMSKTKRETMTDEHKQTVSATHQGKIPWNKGLSTSPETKEKLREAKLGKARDSFNEEWRQKMSDAHKGQTPWNKGKTYSRKPHSEETKQKIRESWARRKAKNSPLH